MFYKNKEYQTREITVSSPELNEGENTLITVGVMSMSDAMGDDKEVDGTDEAFFDAQIECYIDDKDINVDGKEMAENLLYIPFVFICEGEEF